MAPFYQFFHDVLILVEGCQPNEQVDTEKGRTALHAAAAGGYLDIITCLKMVRTKQYSNGHLFLLYMSQLVN